MRVVETSVTVAFPWKFTWSPPYLKIVYFPKSFEPRLTDDGAPRTERTFAWVMPILTPAMLCCGTIVAAAEDARTAATTPAAAIRNARGTPRR